MGIVQQRVSDTFNKSFDSEKSSGILLIICTVLSLLMTNSSRGAAYVSFWQEDVGGLSLEHWINDGLMAIFFLLIGLELERELYNGELAHVKNALLPIVAAIGGMIVPALALPSHSPPKTTTLSHLPTGSNSFYINPLPSSSCQCSH